MNLASCNASRLDLQNRKGFYESWFLRANHPQRPQGFWIRYTNFLPRGRPEAAKGELWAIFFDGERITAAKNVYAIDECRFSGDDLGVTIGPARLEPGNLVGEVDGGGNSLAWDLTWSGGGPPLLDFPESLYQGGFPKAKALVSAPGASFAGRLVVNGEEHVLSDWVGSQNHNWGQRHTDLYGWGQVAGFDGAPEAFLECGAGKLKIGPFWTPWVSILVLRLEGEEHRLNAPRFWLRNDGRFEFYKLHVAGRSQDNHISALFEAPPSAFVGLPYANPPGGFKTCLNSKIARCELTVTRAGQSPRVWVSEHRAALELTFDSGDHEVPVLDLPSPC